MWRNLALIARKKAVTFIKTGKVSSCLYLHPMQHTNDPIQRSKELLLAFISGFDTLTPDEAKEIANNIPVGFYEKGTVLVREDQVCTTCYFVLEGCLRQYTLSDGNENTSRFYIEGDAAVLFSSMSGQTPAGSYLCCAEDSYLMIGEMGAEQDMYQRFPKLLQITRSMMEKDFGKMQDAFAQFISSSPEERYIHILNTRPELLHRVPQHQLASYIGVTPESLSRIRKRIMKES